MARRKGKTQNVFMTQTNGEFSKILAIQTAGAFWFAAFVILVLAFLNPDVGIIYSSILVTLATLTGVVYSHYYNKAGKENLAKISANNNLSKENCKIITSLTDETTTDDTKEGEG